MCDIISLIFQIASKIAKFKSYSWFKFCNAYLFQVSLTIIKDMPFATDSRTYYA
nr:MAG TPA: hypothetical protein [Bacteriophage sp.]